jgi:hypothetical protein
MSTLGKVNDATAFVLFVWAQGARKEWWMGEKKLVFLFWENKLGIFFKQIIRRG